jgi:O-succinylbenzoic acid--CoA ligase
MFERSGAAHPDADAVVCDGARWSYAQAGAESERIAAGLAALGVGARDRVVLLLGNRPEFLFVLLSVQRLGAIAVPVGVREQRPGIAYVARQCEAKAIVFDDELAARVADESDAPSLRLRVAASTLPRLASVNGAAPATVAAAETDVAVLLYTSGTTGQPKGAMLTHLAIAHSALHYEACMRLAADERSALAVPASHVTGLVATIAAMWRVGGAVVVVREFKADTFVELLARERVTHTLMFARADLSAWRVGGYGGAPMPVATIDEVAARLPRLVLQNAARPRRRRRRR